MLIGERAARLAAESEAKHRALLIEKLKYMIANLRHEKFGQSSERGAILEQLELALADLEEDAAEVEVEWELRLSGFVFVSAPSFQMPRQLGVGASPTKMTTR